MTKEIPAAEGGQFNLNSLSNNITNYVVKPLGFLGIAGFEFDIELTEKIESNAQGSPHYVEDNSVRQDHISLEPKLITLSGYIGEVVEKTTGGARILQQLAQHITIVDSYLPILAKGVKRSRDLEKSARGLTNKNKLKTAGETASATGDIYSLYKQLNTPKTKQAQAYVFFEALQRSKVLMGVQTPYGFFPSMMIKNITPQQGKDSKFMSEFSITLQEFRTASTFRVNLKKEVAEEGKVKNQKEEGVQKGNVDGKNVSPSVAKRISGIFSNIFR